MRWLLISLAALVVPSLVLAAAGMFVDRRHEASSSAVFARPCEAIYAVVSDLEGSAAWRDVVARVERREQDGETIFVEVHNAQALPLRVVERRPPERFVLEIASSELAHSGRWTFQLDDAAGGCRLTITEQGEIPNPMFRFFARFVAGYHASIDQYLEDLGRHFGEPIEIAHAAR